MKHFTLIQSSLIAASLALGCLLSASAQTPVVPAVPAVPAAPAVPVAPAVEASALDAAIQQAKGEKKLLFVKYGWEKCGNCRNLDTLIKTDKVKLPEDEFVIVNVHPREGQDRVKFTKYYGISSGVYPRVVICNSENEKLVNRFGYGQAKDYVTLVDQAKTKHAEATSADQ